MLQQEDWRRLVREFQQKVADLNRQLAEAKKERDAFEKEVSETKAVDDAEFSELHKVIERIHGQLLLANQHLAAAGERVLEAQQSAETQEQLRLALQEALTQKENELLEVKGTLEGQKGATAAARLRMNQLGKEAAAAAQRASDQHAADAAAAQRASEELAADAAAAREDARRLRCEVEQGERKEGELKLLLRTVRQSDRQSKEQLTSQRKELADKESQIDALTRELQLLKARKAPQLVQERVPVKEARNKEPPARKAPEPDTSSVRKSLTTTTSQKQGKFVPFGNAAKGPASRPVAQAVTTVIKESTATGMKRGPAAPPLPSGHQALVPEAKRARGLPLAQGQRDGLAPAAGGTGGARTADVRNAFNNKGVRQQQGSASRTAAEGSPVDNTLAQKNVLMTAQLGQDSGGPVPQLDNIQSPQPKNKRQAAEATQPSGVSSRAGGQETRAGQPAARIAGLAAATGGGYLRRAAPPVGAVVGAPVARKVVKAARAVAGLQAAERDGGASGQRDHLLQRVGEDAGDPAAVGPVAGNSDGASGLEDQAPATWGAQGTSAHATAAASPRRAAPLLPGGNASSPGVVLPDDPDMALAAAASAVTAAQGWLADLQLPPLDPAPADNNAHVLPSSPIATPRHAQAPSGSPQPAATPDGADTPFGFALGQGWLQSPGSLLRSPTPNSPLLDGGATRSSPVPAGSPGATLTIGYELLRLMLAQPGNVPEGPAPIAEAVAAASVIESRGRPGSRKNQFTGVYYQAGRWRAQFSHAGLVHQIGMFDTEELAAQAWDRIAWVYRGRQAVLNYPELIPEYNSEVSVAKVRELMDERMSLKKPRGKAAAAATSPLMSPRVSVPRASEGPAGIQVGDVGGDRDQDGAAGDNKRPLSPSGSAGGCQPRVKEQRRLR